MAFAVWDFDEEDDGRVIVKASVTCYGVDRTEAVANCVRHLLIDAMGGIADDDDEERA